jgi:hypothetical protein
VARKGRSLSLPTQARQAGPLRRKLSSVDAKSSVSGAGDAGELHDTPVRYVQQVHNAHAESQGRRLAGRNRQARPQASNGVLGVKPFQRLWRGLPTDGSFGSLELCLHACADVPNKTRLRSMRVLLLANGERAGDV